MISFARKKSKRSQFDSVPFRFFSVPFIFSILKSRSAEHILTLYILNIALDYQRRNTTTSHTNHTSTTKLTSRDI